MANSVTNLDLISSSQAQKEITANALFDASGPATLFGRRSSTTSALTWGYYGGNVNNNGVLTTVQNGTVQLTNNATNYIQTDGMGNISVTTNGFTNGYTQLYTVITGASSVISYTDLRCFLQFTSGTAYTLMPATATSLGGVKIGSGLSVDNTGLISLNYSYSLPTASATVLGGIKVGTTLAIDGNSVLNYNLPTASTTVIGGVKVDGTTVTINNGVISAAASGGGLADFTETLVTTGQYNTIRAGINFASTNATASSISIAFVPKGLGAFQLQIADGTATGGNVRGDNAVDLQMKRNAANQVASGTYSFAAGSNNRVAGLSSAAIGDSNTTLNAKCYAVGANNSVNANTGISVAIGGSNTMTSSTSGCVSVGYDNNQNSGSNNIIVGSGCLADSDRSLAMGYYASTKGIINAFAFGGGDSNNNTGASQRGLYILRRTISSATTNYLYGLNTNNQSSTTNNQIILQNNETRSFFGHIVLRDTAGARAVWKIEGAILREASASTTALLGMPSITNIGSNAAANIYTLSVTADTTNGGLMIGITTTTSVSSFKVVGAIECTEVINAS